MIQLLPLPANYWAFSMHHLLSYLILKNSMCSILRNGGKWELKKFKRLTIRGRMWTRQLDSKHHVQWTSIHCAILPSILNLTPNFRCMTFKCNESKKNLWGILFEEAIIFHILGMLWRRNFDFKIEYPSLNRMPTNIV